MKGGSPELGLDEPPTKTKSSSKNKCKVKPLATKNGPAGAAASAAVVSKAEHNHGVMTRLVIVIVMQCWEIFWIHFGQKQVPR